MSAVKAKVAKYWDDYFLIGHPCVHSLESFFEVHFTDSAFFPSPEDSYGWAHALPSGECFSSFFPPMLHML